MHTHDRTMLARLGFSDPDKREPIHDLACRYLAEPDTVARLIHLLGIEHGPVPNHADYGDTECTAMIAQQVIGHRATFEWEIAKGYEQYRTTIGFADLMLEIDLRVDHTLVKERRKDRYDRHRKPQWSNWRDKADDFRHLCRTYGIEVKIKPVPLGDLIRQIKLYRSYSGRNPWIAVTAYPLTPSEIGCLRNEDILHMRLGTTFDEYVNAAGLDAAAKDSPEI